MNTVQNDAVAYSVADAARVSGMGRSTVYNAISAGELKARKLGKRTVVLRTDLEEWLAGAPIYSAETKADCPANRAA
ncbi:helix-turn-helix domain-containing protein [Aquamicrobium defluvii]|uniref:Excisionase n=1 Tax=Aquamicrobium defluvii TaxID=69279 RepID=A0A011VDY7_9HYPH|nr:helix-turn-helix domain-containing protein [Aquamicrobium defluvii]EXL06670.1 excisionase [Aquamicrobium defluvii]EZQ14493.1 excisionase [Halopseudomonas bauzanensis]TDR36691.1 excisionase family DNA binding protein [Aquamicrobium defluvii]